MIPSDSPFQKHKTAPLCWFEKDGKIDIIGGRDMLCDWTKLNKPGSEAAGIAKKMINPFDKKVKI